jgi:hypothetical protein
VCTHQFEHLVLRRVAVAEEYQNDRVFIAGDAARGAAWKAEYMAPPERFAELSDSPRNAGGFHTRHETAVPFATVDV